MELLFSVVAMSRVFWSPELICLLSKVTAQTAVLLSSLLVVN